LFIHLFAGFGWSNWSPWSYPTEEHTETRTRSCNSPTPAIGGKNCTPEANSTTEIIGGILVEIETRRVIGKF